MDDMSYVCRKNNLNVHLDGARIFNAITETNDAPHAIGKLFDTISFCFSKGLGAPVGSVLMGNADFIQQARRVRKAFGGGMRQAGYLAAAGIYALDHHVVRLKEDHERARVLADTLATLPFIENIRPVRTNIVFFDVTAPYTGDSFLAFLAQHGIKAAKFAPNTLRFVTHLDFTEEMLEETIDVLMY